MRAADGNQVSVAQYAALGPSLRRVVAGGAVAVIGIVVAKGFEYVFRLVAARSLGADAFGLLTLGYSIIGVGVSLSLFGLPQTLATYIPMLRADGKAGKLRRTIIFCFAVMTVLAFAFSLVTYGLSAQIEAALFHQQGLTNFLNLFVWAVPLMAAVELLSAGFRGFQAAIQKVIITDVLKSVLLLAALFVFLNVQHVGLNAVVFSYYLALGVTVAVGGPAFLRLLHAVRGDETRVPVGRGVLAFALPLALSDLLNRFGTQTDTLVLAHFVSSADLGVYGAALLAVQGLGLVLTGVNFIFLPTLSGLSASRRTEELKTLYVLVSRWTYYITVPLFLAYMVYPRMILGGLFGAAYSARGLPVLRALALGAMFNVSTGSVGVLTLSLRQSRRYLMYDVIALTATATLSILLVPRIGMMGAAVANVTGNVLWNVTALEFVRRSLGIYPFTWSHLRFSAIIACGLAAIVSATSFVPWVVGDARALTAIAVYLPFSVLVVKRFVQQEARGLRLSTVRAA